MSEIASDALARLRAACSETYRSWKGICELGHSLGPDVSESLQVVRGRSGNYGVIYDRRGTDPAQAQNVARGHDRLLRAALGGRELRATAMEDVGYERLYHVGYGSLPTLEQAKARWEIVTSAMLMEFH